jgi:hypothetical protein
MCKVRGHRVIVGFLNNEPKHLEAILEALENINVQEQPEQTAWQEPYVLLLWLSHLLLTPFPLDSISTKRGPSQDTIEFPHLIDRVRRIGLKYLYANTKAQEAAAAMLTKLSIRPDVIKLNLADKLSVEPLSKLDSSGSTAGETYELLGSLRLLSGIVSVEELGHLTPEIYRACGKIFADGSEATLASNAVAKKIAVKIFRTVAILSLRSAASDGPLARSLDTEVVLQDVIDYLLRSLGDKDTPVRYASAKAISMIILELAPEYGHEVIQAILDAFKNDMPTSATSANFATANALLWHGLTLALAHTLFKRSAAPEQLPDILDALIAALQFRQRTATGSTHGTNVRDAANFGIWSLARRYTTAELLSVSSADLHKSNQVGTDSSIIMVLSVQLILSACLDPAGNIRRGSSAALQEVVGRHPDQVTQGIALVQTVDYQAVSLRSRAMIDVAGNAAALDLAYWEALVEGLLGWRGLESSDTPSRGSAATSLAQLAVSRPYLVESDPMRRLIRLVQSCSQQDVELMHGYTLAIARILSVNAQYSPDVQQPYLNTNFPLLVDILDRLKSVISGSTTRLTRSEFPAALGAFVTALCKGLILVEFDMDAEVDFHLLPMDTLEDIVDHLLDEQDDPTLQTIPDLACNFIQLRNFLQLPPRCLGSQTLLEAVKNNGTRTTLQGAGRVFALAAIASSRIFPGLEDILSSVWELMGAKTYEWRVICLRAMQIAINNLSGFPGDNPPDPTVWENICNAVYIGLHDYTIDERGDVGSLVRIQAVECASRLFKTDLCLEKVKDKTFAKLQVVEYCLYAVALEKIDKLRLQVAVVLMEYGDIKHEVTDIGSVSSKEYFLATLSGLNSQDEWNPVLYREIIRGCISCAGSSAEPVLQAARSALAAFLHTAEADRVHAFITTYREYLAKLVDDRSPQLKPALDLLAFLLDMHILEDVAESPDFKWRSLLSTVQSSHFKSNDIPRLLAAVHVYTGLVAIPSIRPQVLTKLVNMLRTNPYPLVKRAVAEALFVVTGEETMKSVDWSKASPKRDMVAEELRKKYA